MTQDQLEEGRFEALHVAEFCRRIGVSERTLRHSFRLRPCHPREIRFSCEPEKEKPCTVDLCYPSFW